jgi:hypothetical protein
MPGGLIARQIDPARVKQLSATDDIEMVDRHTP